jgi:prepilin-type N-terminal cleavage/methylation domain-containing protein
MKQERTGQAFTLIELILVMAILTIAVSLTAPALSSFFKGRTLDSEARQLLSLTREGQSRAVSEGIPVELWIDAKNGTYGLEAEPSFQPQDRKAVSFSIDPSMQLEVVRLAAAATVNAAVDEEGGDMPQTSSTVQRSTHPELPRLRFLPDGTVSDISPQAVKIIGSDGASFWLMLGRSRMAYELKGQG